MIIIEDRGLKRHKALINLSHEHHHGLVFCSRLKKTFNIEKEELQNFTIDFWDKYLKKHFEQEEIDLLPLINDKGIESKFLSDHLAIKNLFWIIGTPFGNKNEQALELSSTLHEHIRFEERIMFPFLEKTAAENLIVRHQVDIEEAKAHKYSPEFWKNENK